MNNKVYVKSQLVRIIESNKALLSSLSEVSAKNFVLTDLALGCYLGDFDFRMVMVCLVQLFQNEYFGLCKG